MKKLSTVIGDIFEELGVYVFTLLGIMLNQYVPILLKQGTIDTPFQWIRLVVSSVLALYIVMKDESGGDPQGKKGNLRRRLAAAFSHGFMFNQMVDIVGQAAGQ
jgi:hypothetical protein